MIIDIEGIAVLVQAVAKEVNPKPCHKDNKRVYGDRGCPARADMMSYCKNLTYHAK